MGLDALCGDEKVGSRPRPSTALTIVADRLDRQRLRDPRGLLPHQGVVSFVFLCSGLASSRFGDYLIAVEPSAVDTFRLDF